MKVPANEKADEHDKATAGCPPSFKVENGPISGQVVMRGKPVSKAVSYMAQFGPIGSDGKPGSWTELSPVTFIRSITVHSLTPGTTYAFQMRPGPGRLYELERLRNPHVDVLRQDRPHPRKRERDLLSADIRPMPQPSLDDS